MTLKLPISIKILKNNYDIDVTLQRTFDWNH